MLAYRGAHRGVNALVDHIHVGVGRAELARAPEAPVGRVGRHRRMKRSGFKVAGTVAKG